MNPLAKYLRRNRLKPQEFAAKAGLPRVTIYRIATDKRSAGIDMAVAIERATGGAVKVTDWVNHRHAA